MELEQMLQNKHGKWIAWNIIKSLFYKEKRRKVGRHKKYTLQIFYLHAFCLLFLYLFVTDAAKKNNGGSGMIWRIFFFCCFLFFPRECAETTRRAVQFFNTSTVAPRKFEVICPSNFSSNFRGFQICGVVLCGKIEFVLRK